MNKFYAIIAGILGGTLPAAVLAQKDGNVDLSLINVCPIGSLSCAPDIDTYIRDVILNGPTGFYVAFFGLLFLNLVLYTIKMLFAHGDDAQITEAKDAYTQAIFGTVLIMGASALAMTFAGGRFTTAPNVCSLFGGMIIIDPEPFQRIVGGVVLVLKSLVGIALIVNIFRQGVLLVLSQEDDQISKARKRLLHGIIGAAIVLLAGPIINTAAQCNIDILVVEIIGITNYLLSLFGVLAVVAFIVGGLLYILSIQEELKERAKKIMLAGMIAVLTVISAYAIANVFIFNFSTL